MQGTSTPWYEKYLDPVLNWALANPFDSPFRILALLLIAFLLWLLFVYSTERVKKAANHTPAPAPTPTLPHAAHGGGGEPDISPPPVQSMGGGREGGTAAEGGKLEISLARLPTTGPKLFGREDELAELDRHLADGKHVVSVVAEGGIGKSALVNAWRQELEKRNWAGARRVFAWSFYRQGSDEQGSADLFIAEALAFFGHAGEMPKSPWDRGVLLAQKVRAEKSILVLDGLEPLQHPPGPMAGRLKDQGLEALLKELAAANPGLCLVTTRIAVADLADHEAGPAPRLVLRPLSPRAGAALLDSLGVKGARAELEKTAAEFEGHALALTLLGTWLRDAHRGEIGRRAEVRPLQGDRDGHARRMLESYCRWLQPRHVAALALTGLFDRPAAAPLVAALRAEPAIPGLTDELTGLGEAQWRVLLGDLSRARLLTVEADGTLDAHPLVRDFFRERLRDNQPQAWAAAHSRLYEHLRDTKPEFPDTAAGLEPLYQAIAHGCAAGRHQEALDEVLWKRIDRGDEGLALHHLGLFGAYLSALAGFFSSPWRDPVAGLTPAARAFLLNTAGFTLRGVGRLGEALEAMRAALASAEELKNWEGATIAAANLGETLLLSGSVAEAVATARRAAELADLSPDDGQRMARRSDLADALAQAGQNDEAAALFAEAEAKQAAIEGQPPRLWSVRGYQYCDLLLDRGRAAEVKERAVDSQKFSRRPLGIALATLALGRAALLLGDIDAAKGHLDDAVVGLRRAGQEPFIPLGLLARAELWRRTKEWDKARRDLDEVRGIAGRGGMKLYLADLELEEARLALAKRDEPTARDHLARAKLLVAETGYHRRDGAVAELEAALA